jgi:hypothetical protein
LEVGTVGEKGVEAIAQEAASPGTALLVDAFANSPFANTQSSGELGPETIPTQAPSPGAVAGLNAGLNAGVSDNSDLMWKQQMNDLSPAPDISAVGDTTAPDLSHRSDL